MIRRMTAAFLAATLIAALTATGSGAETLTVDTGTTLCEMSDTLYGLFFEDINHAADGGLYAELL